jgi:hypothetical protein
VVGPAGAGARADRRSLLSLAQRVLAERAAGRRASPHVAPIRDDDEASRPGLYWR